MQTQQSQDVLGKLPTPHEIRMSLADRLQDVRMLKQLLKITEERQQQDSESREAGQCSQ